ncbi:hypothetical protein ACOSQ3_002873 [Xanthoceras sorbifolium]
MQLYYYDHIFLFFIFHHGLGSSTLASRTSRELLRVQLQKLACSIGIPCQGVDNADIDLTYTGNGKEAPKALNHCSNVRPRISGKTEPASLRQQPR